MHNASLAQNLVWVESNLLGNSESVGGEIEPLAVSLATDWRGWSLAPGLGGGAF